MNSREITLWLEERWYDALSKYLKDETVEEHLENVLDEMCNQLPRIEYERISQEIWQEQQAEKEKLEASRTWSAYHVTERGEERYFKVSPGEELLDTARKLRIYLKSDSKPEKFISQFSRGVTISPENIRT